MSSNIHPTAVIEGNVEIDDAVIEPYVVLKGNIKIGKGTIIKSGTCIYGNVTIGIDNTIGPNVVIGSDPQDLSYSGQEVGPVIIGDKNIIREFATIHKPTSIERKTTIGNECLLMVGTHVAHDVTIGNKVILVNYAQIAGFVEIDDGAFISSMVGIHQHSRIGKFVIVGALSKVTQDVPPFTMAVGSPAEVVGINSVGLRRNGFTPEERNTIKECYKIIYNSQYNITEAAKKLLEIYPNNEITKYISEFVISSNRGIVKGFRKEENVSF